MTDIAIPKVLEPFAGRIMDVDSHEMMPAQLWEREFGPVTRDLNGFLSGPPNSAGGFNHPGYEADTSEITPETIWMVKGPTAPGSSDPRRRLEVMDLTGVKRQLLFPSAIRASLVSLLANVRA